MSFCSIYRLGIFTLEVCFADQNVSVTLVNFLLHVCSIQFLIEDMSMNLYTSVKFREGYGLLAMLD
jgi:hypothetical protein